MRGFKVKTNFPKIIASIKRTFAQYLRVSSITGFKYLGHDAFAVR